MCRFYTYSVGLNDISRIKNRVYPFSLELQVLRPHANLHAQCALLHISYCKQFLVSYSITLRTVTSKPNFIHGDGVFDSMNIFCNSGMSRMRNASPAVFLISLTVACRTVHIIPLGLIMLKQGNWTVVKANEDWRIQILIKTLLFSNKQISKFVILFRKW